MISALKVCFNYSGISSIPWAKEQGIMLTRRQEQKESRDACLESVTQLNKSGAPWASTAEFCL